MMLVCIWGRGGVDFGGKADHGPNAGTRLVLMSGATGATDSLMWQ